MSRMDQDRLRLPRLRRASRHDINRMTPEQASDWMDAITDSVGAKAKRMWDSIQGEIQDDRRTLDTLDKAWGKWDWDVLNDLGLLDRHEFAFVKDFLGEYSRTASRLIRQASRPMPFGKVPGTDSKVIANAMKEIAQNNWVLDRRDSRWEEYKGNRSAIKQAKKALSESNAIIKDARKRILHRITQFENSSLPALEKAGHQIGLGEPEPIQRSRSLASGELRQVIDIYYTRGWKSSLTLSWNLEGIVKLTTKYGPNYSSNDNKSITFADMVLRWVQ